MDQTVADGVVTPAAELLQSLETIAGARVLCVGDVMLDRFVYGGAERISPEAPIPVLRVERQMEMLGGAGNVARNLAGLGVSTTFVSVVGRDAAGTRIAALLGELTGTEADLVNGDNRTTSIKTRYIAGSQQMLRADEESLEPLDGRLRESVLKKVLAALPDCGAVILADYGKGMFGGGLAKQVISLAIEASVPVVVDPQGRDFAPYSGADLVTPNLKELAEASGQSTDGDEAIVTAANRLIDGTGVKGVLATRSADGMSLIVKGEAPRHFAAEARDVFDVSGAGDTVAATMAAGLAAGIPVGRAVELANTAAGIVVGKIGTAVAYADDIAAALRAAELAGSGMKIVPRQPAVDRVEQWRGQGLKVGFTNGCFDLLHPGHLSVIAQARKACDRLIVALNSDASTTRLKGPKRPIQGEAARAAVLASLETVDLVVIFEDDTPADLIELLKPEVFVKGADYRIEDIPEAKIVQAYGGEIVLAELADGHSTTSTIARIAE